MTKKLNQDALENLFSYLKGVNGANVHFTPTDFQNWWLFVSVTVIINVDFYFFYLNSLKWNLLGKYAHVACL